MRRAALLLALPLVPGAAVPQPVDADRAALIAARREAAEARARADTLERQADAAASAAARARAQAAAVGARLAQAEKALAAAQARVRFIDDLRRRQRDRLARSQGPVVRLAAALETLARRPPAVALVQPGSLDDVAHVRALLGAAVPQVAARTAAVRAELRRSEALRLEALAAGRALVASRAELDRRRVDFAALEDRQRGLAAAYTASAEEEATRALALGEDARDLVDRMTRREAAADVRRRLGTLPDPLVRAGANLAPARDPGARPRFRLPVAGAVETGFGEVSDAGVRARGLTLATAPDAAVVAPARGRVGYAGRFRSYGTIVIVDHGGGWTTLVTGLAAARVRPGDQVRQGAVLGRAPPREPHVTIEIRRALHPIDMAALAAAG